MKTNVMGKNIKLVYKGGILFACVDGAWYPLSDCDIDGSSPESVWEGLGKWLNTPIDDNMIKVNCTIVGEA